MGTIIFGTILIVLGLSALLGVSLFKFVFALILIAIGIRIIIGKDYYHQWNWDFKPAQSTTNDNFINEVNIFSRADKAVKSEDFKGGKIVMIFSGGKIDLSQAKTSEKNIELEIVAIFGGGELIIPKGWKVNSQATSILGGYDVKVEGDNGEVILNLKGAAIFGGMRITN